MRHRSLPLVVALAVLVLATSACLAEDGAAAGKWRILDSTALAQKIVWETEDWDNFTRAETAYPAFSFSYPAEWKFNGYSVFTTSTDVKIAELTPGVVRLGTRQDCFANADAKNGVVPGRAIRVGKFHGRKVVGKFEDDDSGSIWHHVGYCLTDGEFAFLISFTLKHRDALLERQFARVVSSFQFVAKDGK